MRIEPASSIGGSRSTGSTARPRSPARRATPPSSSCRAWRTRRWSSEHDRHAAGSPRSTPSAAERGAGRAGGHHAPERAEAAYASTGRRRGRARLVASSCRCCRTTWSATTASTSRVVVAETLEQATARGGSGARRATPTQRPRSTLEDALRPAFPRPKRNRRRPPATAPGRRRRRASPRRAVQVDADLRDRRASTTTRWSCTPRSPSGTATV